MVPMTQRSEVNDQSVLLYYNTLPEVKAFRLKEERFLLFIVWGTVVLVDQLVTLGSETGGRCRVSCSLTSL